MALSYLGLPVRPLYVSARRTWVLLPVDLADITARPLASPTSGMRRRASGGGDWVRAAACGNGAVLHDGVVSDRNINPLVWTAPRLSLLLWCLCNLEGRAVHQSLKFVCLKLTAWFSQSLYN